MIVAGVPEHFNIPVKRVTEIGYFKEVKGGSGAMLEGLCHGRFDVIIALTESLIGAIEKVR